MIYDKGKIVFGSKLFNKNFISLTKDFISLKFSYNQKDNFNPELTPPIFVDYNFDLTLDRQFKEILSVIPLDKRSTSRSIRLRKYIESRRLRKKDFLESKDGKEMEALLKENQEISEDIFRIVQKWVLNNYFGVISENIQIENENLTPFWHFREVLFRISQYYEGNSTNWAIFDNDIRELGKLIIEDTFPKNALILKYTNLSEFKKDLLSPKSSNIRLTKILNSILNGMLRKIKIFDGVLEDKNIRRFKQEKPKVEDFIDNFVKNVIKKLIEECLLKELDIIQFLDQFPTDNLKKGMAILLDNIHFRSMDGMAKDLIEEIKNSVDNFSNVYLVLFEQARLKSQDIWTNIIPKFAEYKFKIIKSIDLLDTIVKLKSNKKFYFIFPDDIIGSGEQFVKYFKEDLGKNISKLFKIKSNKSNIHFIIVAGVGSIESKDRILKEIPVIDIIRFRKTIREEDRAFSNHIIKDKVLLEELVSFLKEKDPKLYYGRDNTQFLVACQLNVPNNTIGCLWHKTKEWDPLFKRISYNKSL